MNVSDEHGLRELLQHYEVGEPRPALVVETQRLMRQEMAQLAREPVRPHKGVMVLVGLTVVMSLCFFYMFTVGTILRLVLPPWVSEVLHHSLYAFTAAGSCLLAGMVMVFYFKQIYVRRMHESTGSVFA